MALATGQNWPYVDMATSLRVEAAGGPRHRGAPPPVQIVNRWWFRSGTGGPAAVPATLERGPHRCRPHRGGDHHDHQLTAVRADPDRDLKAKHRALWALGDYPPVATEVIPALGPALVEAAGVGPGDRVLDVAAGSGNAAIPAALTGADVVASDLTPELLEAGRALRGRGGRRA